MADVFYGINPGEKNVTRDTATTGKHTEVVVDDAQGLKKKDVVLALKRIEEKVLEDTAFNDI